MQQTKIEIVGIKKNYKNKNVLENISFEAEIGSCVGVLGGNGSGKSTLLSVLAGVLKADAGSFLYKGENLLTNKKAAQEIIGYVPQGNPLMEELTAWDNLRLWYTKEELQEQLQNGVLNLLGIHEFIKVPVNKMSGGMKKRLSIGCCVASNPKVLLLDEPSAALDLVCKERIYNYLEQFKAGGGSIILVTHDTQELELCDKCYILKAGTVTPYQYDGDIHHLAGRL